MVRAEPQKRAPILPLPKERLHKRLRIEFGSWLDSYSLAESNYDSMKAGSRSISYILI